MPESPGMSMSMMTSEKREVSLFQERVGVAEALGDEACLALRLEGIQVANQALRVCVGVVDDGDVHERSLQALGRGSLVLAPFQTPF